MTEAQIKLIAQTILDSFGIDPVEMTLANCREVARDVAAAVSGMPVTDPACDRIRGGRSPSQAVCIEHTNPNLPPTRRTYANLACAIHGVTRSSYEPRHDVAAGLQHVDGFRFGDDVWRIVENDR